MVTGAGFKPTNTLSVLIYYNFEITNQMPPLNLYFRGILKAHLEKQGFF